MSLFSSIHVLVVVLIVVVVIVVIVIVVVVIVVVVDVVYNINGYRRKGIDEGKEGENSKSAVTTFFVSIVVISSDQSENRILA